MVTSRSSSSSTKNVIPMCVSVLQIEAMMMISNHAATCLSLSSSKCSCPILIKDRKRSWSITLELRIDDVSQLHYPCFRILLTLVEWSTQYILWRACTSLLSFCSLRHCVIYNSMNEILENMRKRIPLDPRDPEQVQHTSAVNNLSNKISDTELGKANKVKIMQRKQPILQATSFAGDWSLALIVHIMMSREMITKKHGRWNQV